MLLTSNFGLKKPEATDPVDVQDFNDNADVIDTELKKRPESDGSATNMTVEFAAATQLTELTNKDSLKGLFGKLALAVKTVIELDKAFTIIEGVSATYTIQPGGEEAIVQTVRTIPAGYKPVAICSASTGNPYVLSRYTSATTGVMRLRNVNMTTAQTGVAHMEVLCVKTKFVG